MVKQYLVCNGYHYNFDENKDEWYCIDRDKGCGVCVQIKHYRDTILVKPSTHLHNHNTPPSYGPPGASSTNDNSNTENECFETDTESEDYDSDTEVEICEANYHSDDSPIDTGPFDERSYNSDMRPNSCIEENFENFTDRIDC